MMADGGAHLRMLAAAALFLARQRKSSARQGKSQKAAPGGTAFWLVY
ncbi:hypothetical protein ART_0877 [Arthrobacter sp. PAMC 25486]|nr:hypothetical protein ART_0877 [Arthrobacter sp. PAMC 25486]